MDLLNLRAVLGLDSSEYKKGLSTARSMGASFLKATGSALTTATKITGVAMSAAATGITALTKSSLDAYADYQQLTGGVETLFGSSYKTVEEYAEATGMSIDKASRVFEDYQNRQETVMKNAKNAYATAGMSANEYMETVTSFAASLNNSLGENAWQSANVADMAVKDMADNANKMGTSMESIQNAYMGFSKQNFQMLDNLKLGYGGTKTEMERLLRDAEKLEGYKVGSLDVNNFADVIEAIHIIQEDLGIYGTTAEEASKTISGSIGMTKSAWENLVTGFSDPDADLGQLIDDVVVSASTALENLVPTIVQALSGIGQAIEKIAPIIGEKLPELIENVLPSLLSAASSLVQSLADALPTLLGVISEQLPSILETIIPVAVNGMTAIINALADALPVVLQSLLDNADVIIDGVLNIMDAVGTALMNALPMLAQFIEKAIPKILTHIQNNMSRFTSNLATILRSVGQLFVKLLPQVLPIMVQVAVDMIKELTRAFSQNANDIISGIVEVINVIITELTKPEVLNDLLNCALTIILAIAEGLLNNAPMIIENMATIIGNLIGWFVVDGGPMILNAAGELFENIGEGLLNAWDFIVGKIGELFGKILGEDGIGGWGADILENAIGVFEKIGEGISSAWDTITDTVTQFGKDIWNGIKDGLGDLWQKGVDIVMSVVNGIKSVAHKINEAIWGNGSLLEDNSLYQKAKEQKQKEGKEFAEKYLMGQITGFDIHSPSKKMEYIGKMVMAGFNEGMEKEGGSDVFNDVGSAVNVVSTGTTSGVTGGNNSDNINALLRKMDELIANGFSVTVPVHIGSKQVEEIYVDSKQMITVRSGGQVDV